MPKKEVIPYKASSPEQQRETARAYGLLRKLRDEAAVKETEKDADQKIRENALRIWDKNLKGKGRRRSKKTRRTRRH